MVYKQLSWSEKTLFHIYLYSLPIPGPSHPPLKPRHHEGFRVPLFRAGYLQQLHHSHLGLSS